MRHIFLIIVSLIISGLSIPIAFGDSLSLNGEQFFFGDTIIISGKVSYEEGNFIGLQILNPSKTDIVVIDQFFPEKDGKFSKSYKAQGPKWNSDGMYSIKLAYNEQIYEKQFYFEKPKETQDSSKTPEPEISDTPKKLEPEETSILDPKLRISGFPNPENSPNYYVDRYANEIEYRDWFDYYFPENSILEIVGYKSTHVEGFPDNGNSPWHYVNRYNAEENYRDWFDSQFQTKSIYEVLGYPESLFQKVPNWIKNNAKWWSSGLISDSDFLKGIEFLINENIIFIPNLPDPGISETKKIPVWVKNTSEWWADDKIDENEFLKGIIFLIENNIIVV